MTIAKCHALIVASTLLIGTSCSVATSVDSSDAITQTQQALTPVPPGTRPNINDLSPQQRSTLVNAILGFITQPILDEHANAHDWHHPVDGELFFIRHHDYLDQLESYLNANGFGQFVPVPLWDPGTAIPPEFLVASPLVTQAPLNANPNQPIPSQFSTSNLCSFATASALATNLESFHDGVHGAVGGAMAFLSTAPGAPIFWLWHGLLDDIYHTYEGRCENRKDFNRDVHTDVLWHNVSTGVLGVWYLDGTSSVVTSDNLTWQAAESTGWQVKGTGDFNGDGRTDVLWHNPGTGVVGVWYLNGTNGTNVLGTDNISWQSLGSDGWEIMGTGDFDRDGHIDILWHNPGTGDVGVWFLNGTTVLRAENLTWQSPGTNGWEIKGTGDFDRDGHMDVLWHNPGTGDVSVWFLNGTTVLRAENVTWQAAGSTGWELKGTGDFNRDGIIDLLWHNPGTGEVGTWYLQGASGVDVQSAQNLTWGSQGTDWKIVSR